MLRMRRSHQCARIGKASSQDLHTGGSTCRCPDDHSCSGRRSRTSCTHNRAPSTPYNRLAPNISAQREARMCRAYRSRSSTCSRRTAPKSHGGSSASTADWHSRTSCTHNRTPSTPDKRLAPNISAQREGRMCRANRSRSSTCSGSTAPKSPARPRATDEQQEGTDDLGEHHGYPRGRARGFALDEDSMAGLVDSASFQLRGVN